MTFKPASPEAVRLFHEGNLALAQIEHNGIRVDTRYLETALKETAEGISDLEKRLRADPVFNTWRREFGEKTNLGSRQQLAHLLFKKLGFKCETKTATNRDKADEQAIKKTGLPFALDYLKLEKLKKMRGTYLKGFVDETVGGYMHPSFSLHLARSYRTSAQNPNFQNIPVRNPEVAKVIRSCFIPRPGRHLVEMDFSGIEVRISCCHNLDPTLINYIKDPSTDMHRDMAMECYLLPKGQVNKESRYAAKNMFVFPQFYGSFYVDCARSMWNAIDQMGLKAGDVPLKEHLKSKGIHSLGDCNPSQKPKRGTFEHHIQQVENDFWQRRFPVYARWKRSWWERYLEDGGFYTKTGFRIEGIYKRNEVTNYPVQCDASQCLIWSVVEILKSLKSRRMKSLVVGVIHDSLVADVPPEELDDFLRLAKEVMTKKLLEAWKWIIVPLDIEAEVAPVDQSWFHKQKVKVS